MNPFGTGGRPRIKKKIDYEIESFSGSAGTTSRPDALSSPVPSIYMQSRFGTCGAHAGAMLINILYGVKASPKYLWKIIKSIDHFGLNDGTSMDFIFQALKEGICSYDLMPNPTEVGEYPAELTIEEYSDIKEITQPMRDDAAKYKIDKYAFTNKPTFEQIKQAIFEHRAVILLVDCGTGWYTPSWADSDVNPLHIGTYIDGHFIVASEYEITIIDGPNSWSIKWGKGGMFNFLENYIPHVLEMGIATLPPTPSSPNPPKYQFTQTLFYGITSPDVHALQKLLGVTDTGFYGLETTMAVYRWQKAHGIWACGIVMQNMRDILNA